MRLVERRRDVPSGMSEARERGAGGGGAAQGMEVFRCFSGIPKWMLRALYIEKHQFFGMSDVISH